MRLALLGLWLAPATAAGRQVVQVPNEADCGTCRIAIEHVTTLGGDADAGVMARIMKFAVDDRGRFYAAPFVSEAEIGVYDVQDGLLETLGRTGEDGREYRWIRDLAVDAGDSLHVFENDRRTVLAPGDRSVVRVSDLSAPPMRAVPLPDGRAIVNAIAPTADEAGLPFHVVGHDGTIVRSFGDEVSLRTPRHDSSAVPEAMLAYDLTEVRDGRFWAAPVYGAYRLQQWDTAGHRIRTLVRDAPWIVWDGTVWNERLGDPPSRITSLRLDDSGRLWVVAVVPAYDWRPAPRDVKVTSRWLTDVIVEVVDPETGRLLTTTRHPGPIWKFAGGEFAYAVRFNAAGTLVADIWRVRLLESATAGE